MVDLPFGWKSLVVNVWDYFGRNLLEAICAYARRAAVFFLLITILFFVFVIRSVQIEFNKPISDFRLGNPILKGSTK